MGYLGVKLYSVDAATLVRDGHGRGADRGSDDLETRWWLLDLVSMTHPHNLSLGQSFEQLASPDDVDLGPSVLSLL